MLADVETDGSGELAVTKCICDRSWISGTGPRRSPAFCTITARIRHLTRLDQPKFSDRDGSVQNGGGRRGPVPEIQDRSHMHLVTASSPLPSVSPLTDTRESYSASNPGSNWN
jgi:hypothetical protein